MPARSRSAIPVLLLIVVACGALAPGASPTPRTSPTLAATAAASATVAPTTAPTPPAVPSATPTRASATASASPTAFAGPVVNADGTVWISQGNGGLAIAGDDAMWAVFTEPRVGRSVVRIDPATNEMETIVGDLPLLPNPIHGMAVNGSVWISGWDSSSVIQYDAETGDEIAEHDVGLHPVEPVYAYGDIWTTNIHGNSVTRIDTDTAVGCVPRIAAIDGALWVKPCDKDVISIMDPDTAETLGEVTSPVTADPPFLVDDVMWLPRALGNSSGWSDGQSFVGLDPETYEVVAEYSAPSRFTEGFYAVGFDSIWMGGLEGILRIPAGTLRKAAQ